MKTKSTSNHKLASWLALSFALVAQTPRLFAADPPAQIQKDVPVAFGIEAEQFQFPGDWTVSGEGSASGGRCLLSGSDGSEFPAVTAVKIPRSGKYSLWVRAKDFPDNRPGTRRFTVSIGAQKSPNVFGATGKAGFTWERGGSFELKAGPVLLAVRALAPFARADALLLTTDPAFTPSQTLGGSGRYQRIEPQPLPIDQGTDPLAASEVKNTGNKAVARLENEFVRLEFVPATRAGKSTVVPRVALKTATGWENAPADPASEIYAVVAAGNDVTLNHAGLDIKWTSGRQRQFATTVEAGGVKIRTAQAGRGAIWNAGQLVRFLPRTARAEDGRVRLDFYPSPSGTLSAEWELRPGERAARVQLAFTPATGGQFALGYHLFFRQPLANVKEILLPMLWQRHRLPESPQTLLDSFAPTPVSLAETAAAGGSLVWGIIGDPKEIPFQWPSPSNAHFGLNIRDNAGAVQPSIYGPVPGTDAARRKAGVPLQFAFRVLVQPGDWYAGYLTAVTDVFGLRDYRRNVGVSLTDAALNMIDLVKDDQAGGWWDRAKSFYQIETKNGATHSTPMILLSLYRLTGDEEIYRRRALPTLEYLLSRDGPHFSPVPQDTGPSYPAGGMDGPVRMFGTATFGGIWDLAQQRTPAFAQIAFPTNNVRSSGSYTHAQLFDEWLARYELTGDTNALLRACTLADEYVAKQIQQPPAKELGNEPFFFISFVPDWEGLLRLYEVTHARRYLDAAAFGARQLMTGIWTQPVIPAGDVTIHSNGQFLADGLPSWRGPDKYRLGTPRKPNDTPAHLVPAWEISNVGLGFEQPSTYSGWGAGRLIYQMFWAPHFLRLAELTGDKMFETYARNAVIGRWANYPGYYATGFTDLPLNPRYPWDGPDVTDFYYHHIPVHLAWTIDYLVSEASQRSGGRIDFPSQRQFGYAYFDTRIYGGAPGKIFDADGAWLWLRRGLVTIDNPQFNYLTAHRGNQFFVILMNESSQEERAAVHFSSNELKFDAATVTTVAQIQDGAPAQMLPLRDGTTEITLPPRGLTVLRLDGVNVDVPAHRQLPEPKPAQHPGYVSLKTDASVEVRAATIQIAPGAWDAYVWCTASPEQARKVTLHYTSGGQWQQLDAGEYPFEFSIPVGDPSAAFRFYVEGETPAGKKFKTEESIIGALQ